MLSLFYSDGGKITYLVELAPTHKPGHLVSGLELLKADDAFGIVAIFIHAVFLGGDVWEHAARSVTVPV